MPSICGCGSQALARSVQRQFEEWGFTARTEVALPSDDGIGGRYKCDVLGWNDEHIIVVEIKIGRGNGQALQQLRAYEERIRKLWPGYEVLSILLAPKFSPGVTEECEAFGVTPALAPCATCPGRRYP